MNNLVLILIGISFALCNAQEETAAAPQERIIGGNVVPNIASASYMVSVQLWNNRNTLHRGHKCGGALISPRHVITTANCVVTIRDGQWTPDNPSLYRVSSGHLNLNQADASANNRRVTQIFAHPLFQPITFLNDVAVLVTNSAFALGSNRQLIRIRTILPQEGLTCQLTGWGGMSNDLCEAIGGELHIKPKNSDLRSPLVTTFIRNNVYPCVHSEIYSHYTFFQISMEMRWLTVVTFNNFQCGLAYNNSNVMGLVGHGNLCATNHMGHAPCLFDVGGPLVCSNELCGILSWAAHCGTFSGNPFVFTRIDVYANWINQIVSTSDASTIHFFSFLLPVVALYHFLQNVKVY